MTDEVMDLQTYLDRYAAKSARVNTASSGAVVDLEGDLAQQITRAGLPTPTPQHRFHKTRRWKIDFAWPDYKVAAEVNGGTWVNGRHNRPSHIGKEYEKLNHLALDGWLVFLFTGDMVKDGTAVQYLIDYFKDVQ